MGDPKKKKSSPSSQIMEATWLLLSLATMKRTTPALAILKDLLLPFAEHTKVFESYTNFLCLVVPALLDLRDHLSEFSRAHARSYKDASTLAQKMRANMEQRFSLFLDVTDDRFSPLAAAACFVDPSVSAEVLIENEDEAIHDLLKKAEDYITRSVTPRILEEEETDDEEEENGQTETAETAPMEFRNTKTGCPKLLTLRNLGASQSDTVFALLKPLALDLLAIPASQAFAEHVFSVTGDLTTGRRNRARNSLERSAFLKLNKV